MLREYASRVKRSSSLFPHCSFVVSFKVNRKNMGGAGGGLVIKTQLQKMEVASVLLQG